MSAARAIIRLRSAEASGVRCAWMPRRVCVSAPANASPCAYRSKSATSCIESGLTEAGDSHDGIAYRSSFRTRCSAWRFLSRLHSGQHLRQLYAFLGWLGVTPDEPLTHDDLRKMGV